MKNKTKKIIRITASIIILTSVMIQNFVVNAEIPEPVYPTSTISTINDKAYLRMDKAANGLAVYAWHYENPTCRIQFVRYDQYNTAIDGVAQDVENTSTCNNSIDVATDKLGNFVVAWVDDGDLYMKLYKRNLDTLIATNPIVVNDSPSASIDTVRISMTKNTEEDSDLLGITWKAADSDGDGVYAKIYPLDFTVADGSFPSYVPSDTTTEAADPLINSNEVGNQIVPDISFSAGHAAVVWEHDAAIDDKVIMFRALKTNNVTNNSDIFFTPAYQISSGGSLGIRPSIAGTPRGNLLDPNEISDNFFISWDNDNNSIYARKISCSTSTNSCDPTDSFNTNNITVRVNNFSAIFKGNSRIAVYQNENDTTKDFPYESSSINYVSVVWLQDNTGEDFSYRAVKGQNFTGNLNRIGTNYNITTKLPLLHPESVDIAMDTDGDYSVFYPNEFTNNLESGNYINEFAKAGQESLVNTPSTDPQYFNDVAVANNGNYVITYPDVTNMAMGSEILYRVYDSEGNSISNTKIANTTTTLEQTYPSVAFFTDAADSATPGKFIIAWQGHNGTDFDIYYQLFEADGSKYGPEHVIALAGNQVSPSVSASTFIPTNGAEQEFVIAYEGETPDDSYGIGYYYSNGGTGSSGTVNTITDGDQIYPSVSISPNIGGNPQTSKYIVTWQGSGQSSDDGVYQRLFAGATPGTESTVALNVGDIGYSSPNVSSAVVGTDLYYIVTYSEFNSFTQGAKELAKTYNYGNSTPVQNFTVKESPSALAPNDEYYGSTSVSLEPTTGNAFIAWDHDQNNPVDPLRENEYGGVSGRFYKYLAGNLVPFGPIFKLASYRGGYEYGAKVAMNAQGINSDERIAVSTWSSYDTVNREDNNGLYHQRYSYPFTSSNAVDFNPTTSQLITQSGKYLVVPSDIEFGDVTANAAGIHNIRTNPILDYVEITDLDGTPFNLTVDASNLELSPTEEISNSYLAVQNGDTSDPSLGEPNVLEMEPTYQNPTPDLVLDPSTTYDATNDASLTPTADWPSLDSTRTLATKATNKTGVWRIYPRFKLIVPSGSNTGLYSGTITFTLI